MRVRVRAGFALLLSLSVLLGLPTGASAQSASIVGTVLDAQTGLALSGVTVRVQGTDVGTVSNADGRFALRGVSTGAQTLSITYLGYGTTTQNVNVTGGVVGVRIALTPQAIDVDGLTVVSRRRGQAAALGQQQASSTITNVVASDQIGRFPDANIGDAVKRIPGIVVIQDQGEARFGLIRGTEPRLNSVMINGERIPSAEAEVREVQLDLVPSDMVSQVEVTKALTPDMDADAIGGAVNLVTRAAPAERRISATLGSGRNFIADDPMFIGSADLRRPVRGRSPRRGAERLVLRPPARLRQHRGRVGRRGQRRLRRGVPDPRVPDPPGAAQPLRRSRLPSRRREHTHLAVDLQPPGRLGEPLPPGHRDGRAGRLREHHGRGRAQSKGGLGNDRIDNRRLEDQRTQSHSLTGEHIFGGALLTWSAQWARASEERPNERYIQFIQEDVPVTANISTPVASPVFGLPATVPGGLRARRADRGVPGHAGHRHERPHRPVDPAR